MPTAASPSSPRASSIDKLHSVRAQTRLGAHHHDGLSRSRMARSPWRAARRMPMLAARSAIPSLTRWLTAVEPARSGHADLHLRHHRRAQRRRSHPRQHRRQPEFRRSRFRLRFHRCLHLVPAALARYRPRPRLRDVQLTARRWPIARSSTSCRRPCAKIRPTVIVGVPRVYEKIRQAVEQKSAQSPVKKRIACLGNRSRRALRRHCL